MKNVKEPTGNKNMINWKLSSSGVLTVSGEGKIPDCDCGKNPAAEWAGLKKKIRKIHILEGITEIGMNAFRSCENLETVFLPSSLNRIHSRAFLDCRKLTVMVDEKNRDYRYIYDPTGTDKEDVILFGVETFHNTPFSVNKWGEFYVKEDALYIAFPGKKKEMVIPEGIRVLKKFSLNDLDLDVLTFPETLEEIEDFIFSNTTVKEILTLPDSVTALPDYALADCSIKWRENPMLLEKAKEYAKRNKLESVRFPERFSCYGLTLVSRKCYCGFQKLKIKEYKPDKPKDDCKGRSFIMDMHPEVGKSILRRIRNGAVILCVTREEQKAVSVSSFVRDEKENTVKVYRMDPETEKSTVTDLEFSDLLDFFGKEDGKVLQEVNAVRTADPGSFEEWFWSREREKAGGTLEEELLTIWNTVHSDKKINA